MQSFSKNIWSHNSLSDDKRQSVLQIRSSDALFVKTFPELVRNLAYISFNNPDTALFFRGQSKDFKDGKGKTSLMPTIYRKWGSAKKRSKIVQARFDQLNDATDLLRMELASRKIASRSRVFQYEEVAWAILQHYNVVDTPLLDFTHSLRVACSFALNGTKKVGYLLAVGLPLPNSAISFYSHLELLNVRLLSICPPEASRPYHQDGYLAGAFPHRRDKGFNSNLDFANRLVAKFKIPHSGFWDNDYKSIPHNALYPSGDEMEDVCSVVRSKL